jgi:hypothetical protein
MRVVLKLKCLITETEEIDVAWPPSLLERDKRERPDRITWTVII